MNKIGILSKREKIIFQLISPTGQECKQSHKMNKITQLQMKRKNLQSLKIILSLTSFVENKA